MSDSQLNQDLVLLYQGSVKSIYSHSQDKKSEQLIFDYSNRYSIFDWGEMPDHLAGKGESLAAMAKLFFGVLGDKKEWQNLTAPQGLDPVRFRSLVQGLEFAKLKKEGVKHHAYLKAELSQKNQMLVKKVQVTRPTFDAEKAEYNYQSYQNRPIDALVPLEIIFRFGTPKGSSLLKRLTEQPHLLKDLGLAKMPLENELFSWPVIEMSTKLESTDRLLSEAEAKQIAGLCDSEYQSIKDLSLLLALKCKTLFSAIGVELWDGKFEFSFVAGANKNHRDFQLVDSIGPDELRLTYQGILLSKEIFRQHYLGGAWELAVKEAKKMAKARGVEDWKSICRDELGQTPEKLPLEFKEMGEKIYRLLTNELYRHNHLAEIFPDHEKLADFLRVH
jgi:phosphoribosylaminoimidazole-succinocarboxamide synthase